MLKLQVLNSQRKGQRIPIAHGLTIGSGADCQIRAKHPELSDIHARFVHNDKGGFFIEVGDPESHIFVNGRDVLRSELRHQDSIAVGPLRFKIVDERLQSATTKRLNQLLENLDDAPTETYDFAKEDLFYLATKDPALRQRIDFTIPSRDRFIDQCQQFLARIVRQANVDEMKVEAFMTCAKELILNAHRHGHNYDANKTITLRFRDLGDKLSLTIEDEGEGFDHRGILGQITDLSAADAARKRYQAGGFGGLGFQMVTRMCDSLEYNEPGNVVTFTVKKQFE